MLDDHHRVAVVDQAVEDFEEFSDVLDVQTDAWLLDEVEVGAGGFLAEVFAHSRVFTAADAPRQLGHQLDPLRLAAADRRAGLAELEVAEAGVAHQGEGAVDLAVGAEEIGGFVDGHLHDFADVFAVVFDLQGGRVVALAVAVVALDVGCRQEIHLQLDLAVALAGLAAAALGVEGKAGGGVAAGAGFGELGEELADFIEDLDVGRRRRARSLADRGLVDVVHGGDVGGATERRGLDVVREVGNGTEGLVARLFALGEQCIDGRLECTAQEARLAGAGDAGDHRQATEWQLNVDVLQVVGAGALDLQPALAGAGCRGSVGARRGEGAASVRPVASRVGESGWAAAELFGQGGFLLQRSLQHDLAAEQAGAGAEVDDVVGTAHGVVVVLNHQQRIALLAQLFEGVEQGGVVARVQADGRLVEDVEHAAQVAAELGGEADALAFAAAEGGGGAVELQVAEADFLHELQPLADLGQDIAGDGGLGAGELEVFEMLVGIADGKGGDGIDGLVGDAHGEGDLVEAGTVADRAGDGFAPGFRSWTGDRERDRRRSSRSSASSWDSAWGSSLAGRVSMRP